MLADFEAGIGTLSRLGDQRVDVVLVVVEPSAKSLEVAGRVTEMARDKGHGRVIVVANRIRNDDDLRLVRSALGEVEIVPVPDDPAITQAERNGEAPLDTAPDAPAVRALVQLAERLVPAAG